MVERPPQHVREEWEKLSPEAKFQAMYGTTLDKATAESVFTHIKARFTTYNRWKIGYGNFNRGGAAADLELQRVGAANDAEYFKWHVYPAARTFLRGIDAAQPFVEEDLSFIKILGADTKSEASIETMLDAWNLPQEQRAVLQGRITLKVDHSTL